MFCFIRDTALHELEPRHRTQSSGLATECGVAVYLVEVGRGRIGRDDATIDAVDGFICPAAF